MLSDKLKTNDEKTEFMIIGTRQQLCKVNVDQLTVGDTSVAPVAVAKNLGTWLDSNLNLQAHINKTCRAAFYHLNRDLKHQDGRRGRRRLLEGRD